MKIKKCGIYQIINTINNKKYIGSSKNIQARWTRHRRELKQNKHHSFYLQRAYNLYGESSFKYEIIEECNLVILLEKEKIWINKLNPEYNVGSVGGGDNLSNNPNRSIIIEKIKKTLNNNNSKLSKKEKSERWGKFGESNPNWRGGSSKRKCKCGKIINCTAINCMNCNDKTGKNNPFYGKNHSIETIQKISKANSGKIPKNRRKISINGIEYNSLACASKKLNIHVSTICHRLKTKKPGYYYIT